MKLICDLKGIVEFKGSYIAGVRSSPVPSSCNYSGIIGLFEEIILYASDNIEYILSYSEIDNGSISSRVIKDFDLDEIFNRLEKLTRVKSVAHKLFLNVMDDVF